MIKQSFHQRSKAKDQTISISNIWFLIKIPFRPATVSNHAKEEWVILKNNKTELNIKLKRRNAEWLPRNRFGFQWTHTAVTPNRRTNKPQTGCQTSAHPTVEFITNEQQRQLEQRRRFFFESRQNIPMKLRIYGGERKADFKCIASEVWKKVRSKK